MRQAIVAHAMIELAQRMAMHALAYGACAKRHACNRWTTHAAHAMMALGARSAQQAKGCKMATSFTAKEMAALCGTDPKTFRRYVRAQATHDDAIASACGQGNRYGFDAEQARALRDGFAAWAASKGTHAPERTLAELEDALDDSGEEDA
jgi:hypothetical protein